MTEQQPNESSYITVHRDEDGRWSWTYAEGDLVIESADTYGLSEEAADVARSAYPGVRIAAGDDALPEEEPGLVTRLLMSAVVWRRARSR